MEENERKRTSRISGTPSCIIWMTFSSLTPSSLPIDSLKSFFCSKLRTSSSEMGFLPFFFDDALGCLGGALEVDAVGAFSFFSFFFFSLTGLVPFNAAIFPLMASIWLSIIAIAPISDISRQ